MPVNDDASSGDYGYDLAHEMKSILNLPISRQRTPPSGRMAGRELDLDGGDFGYDQAHEH